MTPKFKHDCKDCELFCSDEQGDWYHCKSSIPFNSTLLIRKSDEPSDYFSLPISMLPDRYLIGGILRGMSLTEKDMRHIIRNKLEVSISQLDFEEFNKFIPDSCYNPSMELGERLK